VLHLLNPFEQALPYRTGNNIAEQMVRARFVTADVAAEWKRRGADYAREQRAESERLNE
jgi:hypothetical protein